MKKKTALRNVSIFGLVFALIFFLCGTASACRMYGAISDNVPSTILQNHLVDFPNSLENLSPANPDGWSVGYYFDMDPGPTVNRGFPAAINDPNFNLAVTEAASVIPRIVISHVRNTSSGITPDTGNPHPFERLDERGAIGGKYWLMSHNGSIDKNVLLGLIRAESFDTYPIQYGSNQSEWIDTDLYQIFILQTLKDFRWEVKPALGYVILKLREQIGPSTSPSTEQLNFLLTDGTTLWAYREGNSTHTLFYLNESSSVTDPYSAVASQYPSASQDSWIVIDNGELVTLSQNSAPVVENIEEYFGGTLLVDNFFDDSFDSPDLRLDSVGQDWYESRADDPERLTLQSGYISDGTGNDTNASAKAALLNYGFSSNAYLTQEFSSEQTDVFAVSFDIFIDRIEDSGGYDRSGLIYIGDDTVSSSNPPTGTSNERSVFMAFYDSSPGETGNDLEIRARTLSSQAYATTAEWTTVTTGLSYDTWYTIKLVLDVTGGTYDVYVNNELVGMNIPKFSGYTASSVTHISFVADSDGRGDFYVDNVLEPVTPIEPGSIQINADFDSGSIGSYSINGNEIDLTLRTEEFVNPSANPYYTYWTNFVVSGVQDQEITFNITNGDDVPFLTGLDGSGMSQESQMVYTCDGLDWERLTDYSYAAGTGTYTFTQTFPCDSAQIATFFPFSYGYMHDYVDFVSTSQWATETVLGQSEQGRDIDLLTISNTAIPAGDKTDIYIISRQHSGEIASSHMLEGMIDFLISGDPFAQIMRDNFIWHIVPMVNPDGVYEGNSRATSLLRDPNRDWHPLNTESVEIDIVRQHLASTHAANGIEMFIDWHSQMSDDRWYNFVYSPPGNTFFDTLSYWTDFDSQEALGTSCGVDACTARGYATLELGLSMFVFEPTPHLDTWTIESLQQEGVNVAYAIAEQFEASGGSLLVDSGFEDSIDSTDLLANTAGQDWYESRGDAPGKLTLDTTTFGSNVAALKHSDPAGDGYAYLTQDFPSPISDTFCVFFDMYIDSIADDADRDRSGMIYIGDDSGGTSGPNSTSAERFVYMAFYDPDLTNSDEVDDLELRARDLNSNSWNTTNTWIQVATGLSYDTWYTVKVEVNVSAGTYDVYVNDVLEMADIPKFELFTSPSVTHISFSTGTAAQGDFFVDNVEECASSGSIQINADFDSGSIGSYSINGNEIDLTLRTEEFVNPSANPYYTYWTNFVVSGVQDQEITFNITNGDDVPFLTGLDGSGMPQESQMVYTCDGLDWERLTDYSYAAGTGTYTFTQTFPCDSAQIATFFPFSYGYMHDYVDFVSTSQWATETVLGQSEQGRDIDLLTISNTAIPAGDKTDIYIIGRQHSGEIASSHMLEGMIDFLISGDPFAQIMRDNFIWHIVPMVNPDGVYEGNSRATSLLRDPNRDWHPLNTESVEIDIVRQHLASTHAANGIEMFIDWHSQMSDDRWYNFVYSPPGNTFFDTLSYWTDFDSQEALGTSCGTDACSARGYATLELGLSMFGFEPTPHLDTWTIESLQQEGVNVAYAIAEQFEASGGSLLVDSGFEDSIDSADLLANTAGQDWYESRGDAPGKLTLDTTTFGSNVAALKHSDPAGDGYAYLTQDFPSPISDTFCISFDMYIDTIFDDEDRDRSGMIYIGDDSGGTSGPNSTSAERFVYMAFYDPDLTNSDEVDDLELRARDLNSNSWNTTNTWIQVATGLSYDTWYTVKVEVNVSAGTYDVYVNDVLEMADIPKFELFTSPSVTHISFSTGTAAQGDFYVDSVSECTSINYDDIGFDSSFEMGNLTNVTYQGGDASGYRLYTAEVEYSMASYPDKHWWFYYSMDNVQDKTITLELQNLAPEDFSEGRWTTHEPVFSYDNQNWERVPLSGVDYNEAARTFTITFTPTQDRVWLAPIPPYTVTMAAELLASFSSSPYLNVGSLGLTPDGNEMTIATITDPSYPDGPKRKIYIIAQQHSGETLSSFVAEGMIRFLLNESDPRAVAMRANCIFKIIPVANPDGVINGVSRYTPFRGVTQHDLNREWGFDVASMQPETMMIYQDIEAWQPDNFLDMHTDIQSPGNFFLHDGLLDTSLVSLMDSIADHWPEEAARNTSPYSAEQVRTRLGVHPSILIEHRHDPGTLSDWLDWGEGIVLGFFDYYGFTEGPPPEINIISPSDYELGTVQLPPDTTYTYIDDIYMWFTNVPEQYIGLPFIKTAQNDKRVYAEEFLSFQVNQPVVVYVCHSTQISAPAWLSDNFSLNGDQITIGGQAFEVWQREYPAGEIVLGGNRAVGETSGSGAMYSVIIAELAGPLAPQASFMAAPGTGVAPFDVVFTDQSSGDIISWLWDFGDGQTSTLQNPTHTYDSLPGTYSVTLDVSGPGGTDSLTEIDYITIEDNLAPSITSTAITEAIQDRLYSYDVEATDPNASDTITFSLDTSPIGMQIDPVSGLTTWTPSAADVGTPQDVIVRAEDGHGLFDTQNFTISVAGPQPNLPPEITSTPTTTATEGVLYSYDVEATDPDPSDTITFSLSLSPIGMQIDPVSGLITWTPTMAQIGGPHDVTIVVQDNGDPQGFDTQEFAITVEESGEIEISLIGPSDYELGTVQLPPDTTYTYIDDIYMWFTTAPEQYIGLPFIKTAQNDKRVYAEEFLSFQVDQPVVVYVCHSTQISAPAWLSDNFSLNGDQVTIGGQAFEVWQREYPAGEIVLGGNRAVGETSGSGAMYTVIIAELAGPLAPQASFMAAPRAGVAPFDVLFTDQSSGDIISWLWDFGDGETSTLQNPAHTYDSLPGTYSVTLDVSGPGGTDSLTEINYITIEENLAPSITSTAITEAIQDRLYRYDVEATDPNASDTITFSLDTSPIGMQIDPVSGLTTWTPSATDVGVPQDVVIRAEDDHGLFDTQDFTISVAGPQPNLPPEITSTPTTTASEGVLYSYDVEATDPDPSDTITFSLSLSPIGMQIDPVSGLITWTPTMAQLGGPHDVTIVAQDNGDPLGSATQEFAITVEESGEIEISIIGPSDYELGTVQLLPDTTYTYIDDIYMWFTAAPEQYIGLPFIRTDQNDKRVYAEEFLSFQVDQPVVVYVCHSTQINPPAWLSDNFSLNGDQITIDGLTFNVWQREYPAGEIILGGNRAIGETTGSGAMYVVIIQGN